MTTTNRLPRLAAFLFLSLAVSISALPDDLRAQSPFDPVIRVNDKLITRYDIEQRARLLNALGGSGNLEETAREQLIDQRLQLQAAEAAGLELDDEELQQELDRFAERANATTEEFLSVLGRNGVSERAVTDFIRAGVLWRQVVRQRFARQSSVSEEEVERAVSLLGREGGVRVLLSEIILPARDAAEAAASEARAAEIAEITSFEAFAAAARNISVSPSRSVGGRMEWLPINRLPPALRAELLTLPPGGVSSPIRIPNAIGIFQLRALEELPVSRPQVTAIDYAEFRIPNGTPADAREIAGRIDTCDDLFGVAHKLPADRLVREVRPVAEIPGDVRAALEPLDTDETSISVRRGNVQLLLMLCGRTTAAGEEVDRAAVRRSLRNERLESFSAGYLSELRADAAIVELQ